MLPLLLMLLLPLPLLLMLIMRLLLIHTDLPAALAQCSPSRSFSLVSLLRSHCCHRPSPPAAAAAAAQFDTAQGLSRAAGQVCGQSEL